ncbi:MAG: MmgE/PrpD family protein [Alphaproteobacteria bacterium]|jgi:2-methylcitrate dehydratase PrpD|nr:MmgE/PrpD family protein [Alphaproteobacteria bacterium]
MSISDQLARHVASIGYEDLPAPAIAAAKRLIMDTIGTGYAGAAEPGCTEIADTVLADGAAPHATLWSTGERTSAMGAALANGTFAAALDYDSLHFDGVIHPEIVTLPAAMALGEREKRSGRDLITAIIVGGDLMCRMAMSTGRNAAWFVTSTNGTFGAAAAAAIMLGLNQEQVRNALGLALCQASGTIQAVLERTLAKRMQSAFAARSGVLAAELARRGVTGPAGAFEGQAGYYAAFEAGDPEVLMDGLGERYEVLNTGIKKFPSCACNHAAIQAAIDLAREHEIAAADLKRVRVRITPYMQQVVGGEFDPSGNLQVAAQFSVKYSVACALLRRELKLRDLLPARVLERKVQSLLERIEIEIDEGNPGFLSPATVLIETGNGQLQRTIAAIPGSTSAPLSDRDVAEKFQDCMSYGAAAGKAIDAARLFDGLSNLEQVDDLSELMQAVYTPARRDAGRTAKTA